jgi:hypothetical protein
LAGWVSYPSTGPYLGDQDFTGRDNAWVSEQPDLRSLCRAFVAAAFAVLAREHVLPTSVFHSHVAVGRDYFGGSVMSLTEFTVLEAGLDETYPGRFADPLTREYAEFANTYIFSFLEACITRCAHAGSFTPDGPAIEESIDELLAVLEARTYEVVCARQVCHLTTTSGDEVQIGNVTIVPERDHSDLVDRIRDEIPGAPRAWNRDLPRPYGPPYALLIIRETTDDADHFAVARRLSQQLERFLLIARLLTAGTVRSGYEITGMTTLTAPMDPLMRGFDTGLRDTLVRRTVRLSGDQTPAFNALAAVISAADVKRDGIVAASLDVALTKFNGSHTISSPLEHLVDLATALEGVLIGENEGEGLTLRLCSRAAALLACDDDSGPVVFDDVNQLYVIRSKLVHGGTIAEKDLRKLFQRVSTVPAEDAERRFGVALAHAVDRMRDLGRRAILARLCLAESPEPRWPFTGRTPVDAILADDVQRQSWRTHWRNRMAELGSSQAADRPQAAVDFISLEDR